MDFWDAEIIVDLSTFLIESGMTLEVFEPL